jgi:hypothetical protein
MNIWGLNKHLVMLVLDKDNHFIDTRSIQLKTGTIAEHNRLSKFLKEWAIRNYPGFIKGTFINQYFEEQKQNAQIQ